MVHALLLTEVCNQPLFLQLNQENVEGTVETSKNPFLASCAQVNDAVKELLTQRSVALSGFIILAMRR